MQGTQEDIENAIRALAETVLIGRIREFYDDVETTSKTKKEQKQKCIEEFVAYCENKLGKPQEEVRGLVEKLIERYKWIREIEEIEEEEELE